MAKKKTVAETATAAPRVFMRTKNVGMSGDKPFAFHLEGTLTRDISLTPATEDKKAFAFGSIGIGTDAKGTPIDAMSLLARAKHETVEEVETPTPFVNLVFFDKLAEKIGSDPCAKKGVLIAVSGQMRKNTGKDNIERLEVVVDNYTVLRNADAKRNKRVAVAPMTYENKDNEIVTKPIVTLLTGRVFKNIVQGQSATSGTPYLRAGIGLAVPVKKVYDVASTGKAGEYAEGDPSILNLVFFDKDAERMGKLLREGMIIAVTGEVTENVYNGNASYSMRPRSVSVVNYGPNENGQSAAPGTPANEPAAAAAVPAADDFAGLADEDEGMDLPF